MIKLENTSILLKTISQIINNNTEKLTQVMINMDVKHDSVQ